MVPVGLSVLSPVAGLHQDDTSPSTMPSRSLPSLCPASASFHYPRGSFFSFMRLLYKLEHLLLNLVRQSQTPTFLVPLLLSYFSHPFSSTSRPQGCTTPSLYPPTLWSQDPSRYVTVPSPSLCTFECLSNGEDRGLHPSVRDLARRCARRARLPQRYSCCRNARATMISSESS